MNAKTYFHFCFHDEIHLLHLSLEEEKFKQLYDSFYLVCYTMRHKVGTNTRSISKNKIYSMNLLKNNSSLRRKVMRKLSSFFI